MVTLMGNPMTLEGTVPAEGQMAPDFVLRTGLGPDTGYDLSSDAGSVRILNVVPSLDTPVCQVQTKRFNEEAGNLPGVKIITISADLPVAQARWCGAEGVEAVSCASDYYDGNFGRSWGLRITELGVLARGSGDELHPVVAPKPLGGGPEQVELGFFHHSERGRDIDPHHVERLSLDHGF